jgi:hypothetical protein
MGRGESRESKKTKNKRRQREYVMKGVRDRRKMKREGEKLDGIREKIKESNRREWEQGKTMVDKHKGQK